MDYSCIAILSIYLSIYLSINFATSNLYPQSVQILVVIGKRPQLSTKTSSVRFGWRYIPVITRGRVYIYWSQLRLGSGQASSKRSAARLPAYTSSR